MYNIQMETSKTEQFDNSTGKYANIRCQVYVPITKYI